MKSLVDAIRGIISESILNEISITAINHVLTEKGTLPFEDLFQGDLRKVISLNSGVLERMKDTLENKYGLEVDLPNKKAFTTKETQKGPKKVEMRLGKAIGSLERLALKEIKSEFDDDKDFSVYIRKIEELIKEKHDNPILELYKFLNTSEPPIQERKKDLILTNTDKYIEILNIKKTFNSSGDEFQKENEFSIVLSRAPADVLRMSDHEKIKSCHSEGGSYFKCAVTEAINGGAIAYLVKTEDLNKVDDLNDSEIFEDWERRVDGIVPQGRLRIRNFVSDRSEEFAIPEKRTYGTSIAGFKESVINWARENQIDKFKDENGNVILPDLDNFKLRGGNYADNEADDLLNQFFKVDEFSGDIDFENDDDEYRNMDVIIQNLSEELEQYITDANNRGHIRGEGGDGYISFYFDELHEYDDGMYDFTVRASVSVKMPQDAAKALDAMSYSDFGDYTDIVVDKIGISTSDVTWQSPYFILDIEDSDLSTDVSFENQDIDSLTSNIDYWTNYSFDIDEAIMAVMNKLIYEGEIEGYQEDYSSELEDKLHNFKIEFIDEVDEEDFNVIFATATIGTLDDIIDEETRNIVRNKITKDSFTKDFFSEVVNFFKPSLKQLILPNVDYGPISAISAPEGASLDIVKNNIQMVVKFHTGENADEFVEFLTTMDKHLDIVEKILTSVLEKTLFVTLPY